MPGAPKRFGIAPVSEKTLETCGEGVTGTCRTGSLCKGAGGPKGCFLRLPPGAFLEFALQERVEADFDSAVLFFGQLAC